MGLANKLANAVTFAVSTEMGLMLSTLDQHIATTHHRLCIGNLTDERRAELAFALADLLTERYLHLADLSPADPTRPASE